MNQHRIESFLAILVLVLVILNLTGLNKKFTDKKSENMIELFLDDEHKVTIYPEGMTDGGEKIFGNGKNENSYDIFTFLENKIWG